MKTPVSRIAPGKFILYRGEPCIVLEHRKEDTLLAVAKQIERSFGKTNNFNDEDNALQVHLNSVYLDTLTQATRTRSSPVRWTSSPSLTTFAAS